MTERYDGDSDESRRAFREYDLDESVASKTPWQVWRDACAWQARAALSVCADGGKGEAVSDEQALCRAAELQMGWNRDDVALARELFAAPQAIGKGEAVAWYIPDENGKPFKTTGYSYEAAQLKAAGATVLPLFTAPQAECAPHDHKAWAEDMYRAFSKAECAPRADDFDAQVGRALIANGTYDRMCDLGDGNADTAKNLIQELIATVDPILDAKFAHRKVAPRADDLETQAAGTLIAIGRLLTEAGFKPELRVIEAVREVIAKAAPRETQPEKNHIETMVHNAKIIQALHVARYALVTHSGCRMICEGVSRTMDFEPELNQVDEVMTMLGVDLTEPLPAPVEWDSKDCDDE